MMSKNLASIYDLPDVSFIENKTLDDIQAEMVKDYQEKYKEMTGKELILRRADPESLKLYAASIQIYHLYLHTDMAGKMDLLKYAYGNFLDNLGALRGVDRLPAIPATVMVQFTLSAAQSFVVIIPKGTRVSDGTIYFATNETAEIAIGNMNVEIPCTCLTEGSKGNGILAGAINVLVDPIPYMERVINIETTSGGTDVENDQEFSYRIYLAPGSYSVAGPTGAYEYHTRSYSVSIGDVEVTSPRPGDVEVRFLLKDGSLPINSLCLEVLKYLSSDQIRPLTDHVMVMAPMEQKFDLNFIYYINESDKGKVITIQTAIMAAVHAYIEWQTCTIGRDINPSMLIQFVMAAGARRVEILSPAFTVVPVGYVARVSAQNIVYGGTEDD